MRTRFLRVNLAKPLQAKMEKEQLTKTKLFTKLGLSRPTVISMLKDDWQYISRDAIERAADYVGLEAHQVFEFVPVDFWKPIREAETCTYIRGELVPEKSGRGIQLLQHDGEASQEIQNFLYESLPEFRGGSLDKHSSADPATEIAMLVERAKHENCIVIGSPKSNRACEILISRFFDATPFDSSQKNRRKIPFGFCWPENSSIVEESSLTCSKLARQETKNNPGIALKGFHISADYKSASDYRGWSTKGGKDCGLVFVANNPFGSTENVKLIVLAGFSGIGTLAAAKALVKNFRHLEPMGDDKCVYGIVEAKYTKAAGTNVRRYRDFFWRCRLGGPAPGYWPPREKSID